jgi:hypothetical protein
MVFQCIACLLTMAGGLFLEFQDNEKGLIRPNFFGGVLFGAGFIILLNVLFPVPH